MEVQNESVMNNDIKKDDDGAEKEEEEEEKKRECGEGNGEINGDLEGEGAKVVMEGEGEGERVGAIEVGVKAWELVRVRESKSFTTVRLDEESYAVLLPLHSMAFIAGRAYMKVYNGLATLYGYGIASSTVKEEWHPVYAPLSSGAMGFVCTHIAQQSDVGLVDKDFESLLEQIKQIHPQFNYNRQVLVVHLKTMSPQQKITSQQWKKLQQYPKKLHKMYDIPPEMSSSTSSAHQFAIIDALESRDIPLYDIPPSWSSMFNKVSQFLSPSVLVCGKKGAGKSSFIRYFINSWLNLHPKIAYIETDPGQTEFTPSGIVSLSIIDKPVFGPSFTHVRPYEYGIFFGDTTLESDPELFQKQVNSVINRYQKMYSTLPLIVNTGGWVENLGMTSLQSTIRELQPVYVLQISKPPSEDSPPEAPYDLSSIITRIYVPKHIQLSSGVFYQPIVQLNANEKRNLLLGSYFNIQTTPLVRQIPYRVRWNSVGVKVMNCPVSNSQIMYALNASIVGLCVDPTLREIQNQLSANGQLKECASGDYECKFSPNNITSSSSPSQYPIFVKSARLEEVQCVGLGIIRSIDMERREFRIITPVPPEQLKQVNLLLKGAITLDMPFFQSEQLIDQPYLMFGSLPSFHTGEIRANRHLKRRKHNYK